MSCVLIPFVTVALLYLCLAIQLPNWHSSLQRERKRAAVLKRANGARNLAPLLHGFPFPLCAKGWVDPMPW